MYDSTSRRYLLVKFIEIESRMVVTRGWGLEKGNYYLMDIRFNLG